MTPSCNGSRGCGVKHMPYEAYSNEVDPNPIPFWSKIPWHIKCHTLDEAQIEALLAYMDCMSHMEHLFGDAVFHHVNPRPEAT